MQGNNMIYCTELTCSHFHRMGHHCAWGAYIVQAFLVIQIIGPTDQNDHIGRGCKLFKVENDLSKQVGSQDKINISH